MAEFTRQDCDKYYVYEYVLIKTYINSAMILLLFIYYIIRYGGGRARAPA